MPEELDRFRPVALQVFHYEHGEVFETYKIPRKYKTMEHIRELYSLNLMPGDETIYIRLLSPDAPQTTPPLPRALARYGDYEVFLPQVRHVAAFVEKFRKFMEFDEIRHRRNLWQKANALADEFFEEMRKEKKQARIASLKKDAKVTHG